MKRLASLIALLVWILPAGPLYGERRVSHYKVKAAYVYNFFKLMELPRVPRAEEPAFNLCLWSGPDVAVFFNGLEGRAVGERSIKVFRPPTPDDLKDCHMLFIARNQETEIDLLLKKVRGLGILTVGEQSGFCARGGAVNFYIEQDTVQLEMNPARIKEEGVVVNEKLLRSARIVEAG